MLPADVHGYLCAQILGDRAYASLCETMYEMYMKYTMCFIKSCIDQQAIPMWEMRYVLPCQLSLELDSIGAHGTLEHSRISSSSSECAADLCIAIRNKSFMCYPLLARELCLSVDVRGFVHKYSQPCLLQLPGLHNTWLHFDKQKSNRKHVKVPNFLRNTYINIPQSYRLAALYSIIRVFPPKRVASLYVST